MPTVHDIEHHDKRPNIPTEELRDFVDEEEQAPRTAFYPRELHDPQLVWKGKEEQDAYDLAVAAVPIYIQEEIEPKTLINDLFTRSVEDSDQPHLFPVPITDMFERKVDFYQHEETWRNRLILGDSLLVMHSLAEKEGLRGKVQTIYLDPPYGIKFGSNWQVSTRKRDVKDGKAEDATREPEQVKAFRDTWELGIHSYLSYLRDRLTVARELLTESGSIFVQIGDENVHLVRSLMDEVFGAQNAVGQILFRKTGGKGSEYLDVTNDYILWFAKDRDLVKYRQLYRERPRSMVDSGYPWVEERHTIRRLTPPEFDNPSLIEGRRLQTSILVSQSGGENSSFPYEFSGKTFRPSASAFWKTNPKGMRVLELSGRLMAVGNTLAYKRFEDDFPVVALSTWWDDTIESTFAVNKTYVVQTATKVVQRCLLMTTDPGDLVLDPTCGSGTTAYVAEQWGRRWITIDTSRVALALARTRLMSARYPYYLLADSPEGVARESQLTGVIPPEYKTGGDIRKGFVYERVPHVTLKSIANNPEIQEGMSRAEIDAAIARHADQEVLYDRPYEDKKKVRVSGPFSVESLSPHRVLPTDDRDQDGRVSETEIAVQGEYESRILTALKASGVQNTIKGERIVFDRLDPHAHPWLNATGEYTDAAGETKRIAISIGPEHGTVGAHQVNEAAKEAVKGVGFDILVVCGFAFDAQVSEEAKRFGKLTVLPARMNMELIMSGGELKNTGAGNLFMVFGEPDIDVRTENGQVEVEIRDVDVYDPSTGAVRSNSTDDLACWFIDTAYTGEAFFVRHAYFTGATEPYDKLKRALRAEIDETAWSTLYQTTSRPFPIPATGRIAVKAINHYGDEVMKVIPITP